MRTGIQILEATEATLHAACSCDRDRCSFCRQRKEIGMYLDVALGRSNQAKQANSEAM